MAALGDAPEGWEPAAIRSFFLNRASHCGNGTVEKLTTSLRAFLRYLVVEGRSRAGLADVVPGYVAACRLAAISGGGASEPADRGMRRRSRCGQRVAILSIPLSQLTGLCLSMDCLMPGCQRERAFAIGDSGPDLSAVRDGQRGRAADEVRLRL
jgi:hypothetical protein